MTARTYDAGMDWCLSIWAAVWATGHLVFPQAAQVLEIGCAEANWRAPMLTVRPDLQITGIDWRGAEDVPGTHLIQGDILTQDWPAETFDVMVAISAIEHVGLGFYNGDPLDVDGDLHAMDRVGRWLKPGGWAYLDVPFRAAGYWVEDSSARWYDEPALLRRLIRQPLRERHRWYADRLTRLTETPEASAEVVALLVERPT